MNCSPLKLSLALATSALLASPGFGQAGTLDASFGGDGKVTTDILGPAYDNPTDIALFARRNDGRLVVVGTSVGYGQNYYYGASNWLVTRFLEDGTPDPNFGNGGWVTTDVRHPDLPYYYYYGYDTPPVAVVTDGNATLVVGYRLGVNWNYEVVVVRYLNDGSLDPNFGVGGMASYSVVGQDMPFGAVLQDGRLLVGTNYYYWEPATWDTHIIAFQADGTLDTSYGDNGVATVNLSAQYEYGAGIFARSTGGVVLAGVASSGTQYDQTTVAALTASGALDGTFGSGGVVRTLWNGTYVSVYAACPTPGDGIALLAHYQWYDANGWHWQPRVDRYDSSGVQQGSFFPTALSYPSQIASQPDGALLVTGYDPNYSLAVARYLPTGQLDSSFGSGGVSAPAVGTVGYGYQLAALASGKIAVVTYEWSQSGTGDIAVIRLLPQGALDLSFGGGDGIATVGSQASQFDYAQDLVLLQGDGKVLVLAQSQGLGTWGETSGPALLRYEPDGTLDVGFGQNGVRFIGKLPSSSANNFSPVALALQGSGRILVAGHYYDYSNSTNGNKMAVVGFTVNGELDPTFGVAGIALTGQPGAYDYPQSFAVMPDDRIVIGGTNQFQVGSYWYQRPIVARLQAGGQSDPTFGGGAGWITVSSSASWSQLYDIAVAPDGHVAAMLSSWYTGASTNVTELALIPASGSGANIVSTPLLGYPTSVALDDLGRILVGLQSSSNTMSVARFLANGAIDTSFDFDGVAEMSVGTYSYVRDIVVQGDRKVVAAGASYDAAFSSRYYDFAVARWNADGSPDLGFGDGGRALADFGDGTDSTNDAPYAVALQGDGAILLAGVTQDVWMRRRRGDGDIAIARFHGVTTPDVLIAALVPMLESYTEQALLTHGSSTDLQKKVEAALQQAEGGNATAAANQISAFVNKVQALISTNRLSPSNGLYLLDWAAMILTALGAA